jgi:predicted Fe-Mo cluster-binding NifX family protein
MSQMKVAVASDDGRTISQHFGRSAFWLVFEVENGVPGSKEVRNNKSHGQGHCGGADRARGSRSHADLVEALKDCHAVLSKGMGWRAAEALRGSGIQPFVIGQDCPVETALSLYLAGKAIPAVEVACHGGEEGKAR